MNLRGTLLTAALAVGALTCVDTPIAAAPPTKDFRDIEGASTPIYRARDAQAWKTHGRIVGQTSNPPKKFTIVIVKAADKENDNPYKVEDFSGDLSVYETSWLLPGKYRIIVQAEGYAGRKIAEVEVRKGFDCIVDIKFGTHVYSTF